MSELELTKCLEAIIQERQRITASIIFEYERTQWMLSVITNSPVFLPVMA